MVGHAAFQLPDMGFNKVLEQIVAERDAPKTMTLIVEVEATRPTIDEFVFAAKSAHGELTKLGFAFRGLCVCARGGKVSLAIKGETYSKLDFADTQ